MKRKHIAWIVIAFVVLGIMYFLQQRKRPQTIEGLGEEHVLSEDLSASFAREIKCYLGEEEDEGVHLAKVGDAWTVKNRFDAPADETKVDELLEKIEGLRGELRSSSSDVLKDYGISDENALHLIIYAKGGTEKAHLLLGKRGPSQGKNFLRSEGSSDVYVVSEDLRGPFGVYSETNDRSPEAKNWLQRTLLELEKDDPEYIRKWFSENDIRDNFQAFDVAMTFIKEHEANSVAMLYRIIGCSHEEGMDYPEGHSCPGCPFWHGRNRWTGELEH